MPRQTPKQPAYSWRHHLTSPTPGCGCAQGQHCCCCVVLHPACRGCDGVTRVACRVFFGRVLSVLVDGASESSEGWRGSACVWLKGPLHALDLCVREGGWIRGLFDWPGWGGGWAGVLRAGCRAHKQVLLCLLFCTACTSSGGATEHDIQCGQGIHPCVAYDRAGTVLGMGPRLVGVDGGSRVVWCKEAWRLHRSLAAPSWQGRLSLTVVAEEVLSGVVVRRHHHPGCICAVGAPCMWHAACWVWSALRQAR